MNLIGVVEVDTSLTITGDDLLNVDTVLIDGTEATVETHTDTMIEVMVPQDTTTGEVVDVVLEDGTGSVIESAPVIPRRKLKRLSGREAARRPGLAGSRDAVE